ncbi:hypothetical protein FRB96_006790 [Tulasnella sp. 330]|nr:hypothetical protein FRB96_006790 [Tulasnella sp. 330]KAG8877683.1 hypothetical protein FRB97_003174 [Tulasnella sp. 331]KAG8879777.1 hypothetical protein FRB98_005542 [Tulasnella sp. 332]
MAGLGEDYIDRAMKSLVSALRDACLLRSDNMSEMYSSEDELKAVELCLGKLRRRMLEILVDRRRQHNARLAFYRLPAELTTPIISFELFPFVYHGVYNGTPYMQRLRELASVSSGWSQLIKNTSSFWVHVSRNHSLSILQQVLSRSKSNALELYIDRAEPISLSDETFLALISEHSHRWRNIHIINASSSAAIFKGLECIPAPALETLRICDREGLHVPEILFWGKAGCLRTVELDGYDILWDGGTLKGLHHLSLQNLKATGPSARQLLDILAASPELQTLQLQNLTPHLATSPTPGRTDPVELPLLRELSIHELSSPLELQILSAIRVPRCSHFRIMLKRGSPFFQDPSLAYIQSLFKLSLDSSTKLVVKCYPSTILLEVYAASGCPFTLSLGGNRYVGPPGGLIDALEQMKSVKKELYLRHVHPARMIPFLQSKVGFTTIRLVAWPQSVNGAWTRAMMQAWATPLVVEGRRGWVVPELEVLQLAGCKVDPATFIASISKRYGKGEIMGGWEDGDIMLEPCPPIRLEITDDICFKRGHLQQLRNILGETNVFLTRANDADMESDDDGEEV